MKNRFLSLVFFVVFVFFTACGGGDDNGPSARCDYGTYRCRGNQSLYCGSNERWRVDETCNDGCNNSTGKCYGGSSSDGTGWDTTECTEDSCTTIDGYMWSSKASSPMDWDDAVSYYCNNLYECGYSDWHLPTISELRTLIQNCSGTVTGGSCGVTDSCLSYSSCWDDPCSGCSDDSSGYYSKLGDTGYFWSSSTRSESADYVWVVNFYYGNVGSSYKVSNGYVRCVR